MRGVYFHGKKGAPETAPLSLESISTLRLITDQAAAISRRSAMSTSTRSLALSMPRAFRFLSMWAIINRAIS